MQLYQHQMSVSARISLSKLITASAAPKIFTIYLALFDYCFSVSYTSKFSLRPAPTSYMTARKG